MSPSPRRADRVAEAVRTIAAKFLSEDAKDPRLVAMVTVTAVDVKPDLRHARVFVSILGTDSERASSLDALASMTGHLRTLVARALNLRVAPEIAFQVDESVARAARIESLLSQVREKKPGDDTAGA